MRRAFVSILAAAAIVACGADRDSSDATANPAVTTTSGGEPTDETTTSGGETAATGDTDETGASGGTGDTAVSTADTTASTPDDTTDGTTPTDATTATSAEGEIGENEAAYVDAIVEDYSGDNVVTATCIAEAVVSAIGLEQLQAAGVTTSALADTANFSALGVTLDDRDALEAALAACGDGFLILTLSETEATPETQACAEEHVTDEIVAEVLVDSLLGEQPSAEAQAAAEALDTCLEDAAGTTSSDG